MSAREIEAVKNEYVRSGWEVVETFPIVAVAKNGERVEIK
jgi:hypothetical protein